MEIRDEVRRQSLRPNYAALLALCVLLLIWIALKPIWLPCLAWLFSLLDPVLPFLGNFSLVLVGLFMMVMFCFSLAVVALVLGGGIPSRLR